MFSRRAQRHTSLLALFVLLWGLVFPSLVHAGAAKADSFQTEICTAQGIKKIEHAPAPAAQHHYSTEHCALCCLGTAFVVIETHSLHAGIRVESVTRPLPLLHVALPQQLVPLHAPPRAPPVLSYA